MEIIESAVAMLGRRSEALVVAAPPSLRHTVLYPEDW